MEITIESTAGMVLAIPLSTVMKDGLTRVFFKRGPFNLNKAIRWRRILVFTMAAGLKSKVK